MEFEATVESELKVRLPEPETGPPSVRVEVVEPVPKSGAWITGVPVIVTGALTVAFWTEVLSSLVPVSVSALAALRAL